MASLSQVTKKRRRRKATKNGAKQKRLRTQKGTPKFPVHPENDK